MKKTAIALLALLASGASLAATPWQKITHPVAGSAQSIGAFSNGCIVGAQELPLQSDTYQVMRTDQRRYFGHPDLVLFIQRLGNQVHNLGLGTMLIPQALDLVSADGKRVVASRWSPEISSMIKLAAEDNDVTRIFVNPAIKQQLCLDAGTDRDWLRKVRPWFQHRAHMHVRLRCPANSLECEDQPLPPPGDGCGYELQSWFEPAKPGTSKPEKKTPPPLPPSCQALLDEHVL